MRRIGGVAVALLVLGGACGDDGGDQKVTEATGPPASATAPVPTRSEVEHVTLELVDPTRATEAGAGLPHADERRLVTEVYLPAGQGPFPLVAFAHGLAGHPRKFTRLLGAWARAGYAVAAPTFPLSNDEVPGEPTFADLAEQPGDVSFVIDEILAAARDEAGPLYGAVDPGRIGVAGLSLGGATTYGVAYNDCCRDDRPVAAMVLDGARLAVGGAFRMDSGLPLMVVHAEEDPTLPYAEAVSAYADAVAPKYMVTLHQFAHAEPYEDTPNEADDLVVEVTTAFWDRWLSDDTGAEARILDAAASPLASVEAATVVEAGADDG